jgi:hypothetical protein
MVKKRLINLIPKNPSMGKIVYVQIESGGVLQKHGLKLETEKTPFGDYEFMDARAFDFPQKELIKAANKEKTPIFSKTHKVFPNGKTFMDFVKKEK